MGNPSDQQVYKRCGNKIDSKQIVVSGYYGFGNAGDEAVLAGIARSFDTACNHARLVVQSIDPKATTSMHAIDAVHRYSVSDLISSIRRSDLLISGGGSLLQDVTSSRSVLYYLAVIALAKVLRKKTMIYAQGVGPLNSWAVRKLCRLILNRVDLITVRDQQSADVLTGLGVRKPRTLVTADASFAVESADKEITRDILARAGAPQDALMLGAALRPWKHQQEWLPEVAAALRKAHTDLGLLPVFLPMQESMDMGVTISAANESSSAPVVIAEQLGPMEAKGLASAMHVFVSMRLHALIFAASAGVPFVALSYDPKVTEFARIAGQPVIDVQSVTSSLLYAAIAEACEKREEMSRSVRERIEPIKMLAVRNAELACELLEKTTKRNNSAAG